MLKTAHFVRQDVIDKALIPFKDREKYVIKTHLDPMLGHVYEGN